jgi:hypothetical protein
MRISDAIRTLLLLRKPIIQPGLSAEINLEQAENNNQLLESSEPNSAQSSDTEEKV